VIPALEVSATIKPYPLFQELLEEMLLHASYWGWIEVVKHLFSRDGTDVNKSRSNESPLAKAAYKGHLELVRLFLDRPDIDPNAKEGENTPLRYAVWGQHTEIVKLLLDHPLTDPNVVDYLGRPALSSAAARGLTEIVRLLLSHPNIDPNATDPDLMTPVHWAAASHTKATFTLLLAREDVRADARDKRGWTALFHAANAGCTEIVALLLSLPDVDPNQRDYFGQTALIYAAKEGLTAVVRLLLDSNRVDINCIGCGVPEDQELASEGRAILRCKRGDAPPSPFIMTPLAWATFCDQGKIVCMLLKSANIKPDLADPLSNHTPLSLSAQKGYAHFVKLFLRREDVDLNSKDRFGWSPLFHAVAGDYNRGHRTRREAVCLLAENSRVNINSRDNGGKTPLFIAVECGNEDIVRVLLELGANVNAMDNRFRRPLDVTSADMPGSLEKLLLANGAKWRIP
jgi:ankyrin repeat protein